MLARTLVTLAEDGRATGEFEQASGYARRWLALDPLHEPAHRLLMELYAALGQVSAALRQYELCTQTLQEQLGVEPEPETAALYERIRRGWKPEGVKVEQIPPAAPGPLFASAQPSHHGPSNFPTYLTPFIGRESELQDITRLLLDPERRLLTLIGPGGIGKTRLAIQAAIQASALSAARAADPGVGGSGEDHLPFQDGIYFVPLMALVEAGEMVQATAGALNFTFSSQGGIPPRKQLLDYLCGKDLLLVLDNFEHLLDEVSLGWVADLLGASPRLKLLITSRVWLNLQGEGLYPVAGLSVPAEGSLTGFRSPQELAQAYSAVNLFARSAAQVKPDFELNPENLPGVIRVCRLVQGMPLGIELAAAWSEMLSPDEIAGEIERSLDFLESDFRDLPDRQRSLRAVFEILLAQPQPGGAGGIGPADRFPWRLHPPGGSAGLRGLPEGLAGADPQILAPGRAGRTLRPARAAPPVRRGNISPGRSRLAGDARPAQRLLRRFSPGAGRGDERTRTTRRAGVRGH